MSVTRRKLMAVIQGGGGGESSGLPAEYQRVKYIESSRGQFISTGYYPNTDTVITVRYYCDDKTRSPFGVRWTGSPTYYTFGINIAGGGATVIFYGDYSADEKYTVQLTLTDIHTIKININKLVIDGSEVEISRSEFESTAPICLFAWNNTSMLSNTKIYNCTISENGAVLHNYVPCYRISDGEIGMYDAVSGTFLTNQGTGTFTKGADVS